MTATPATDTTTRTTRRLGRRLTAAALAALSLVGVLGLTPGTASASTPTQPREVIASGYEDFVRVHWAPPVLDGGKPVTKYAIERTLHGSNVIQKTWVRTTTAPLVDDDVVEGTSYRYRVRAYNADGWGGYSADIVGYTHQNRQELYRFGNDATDFVNRQYQDFLGRLPTAFEAATHVNGLENGTMSAGKVINDLMAQPARVQLRQPVLRLYTAYFDRAPDHGGLTYWLGKRTGGTKLDAVSANFAGSPEFKNTYGSLDNGEFVELVYDNLFDRDPDVSGKAYWTDKLDEGTSRGRVMTQFSESNEYKGLSRGVVLAADLHDEMFDQAVSNQERILWGAHITAGGNAGDLGTMLTLRNDY